MDNDDMMVTITLPLLDARKLAHVYRWALDQPEHSGGPEWDDIYSNVQRQIEDQIRVQ